MTIEQAEVAYNEVAKPLLEAFQAGVISFQEWSSRHSHSCATWRSNLYTAMEGFKMGDLRNAAIERHEDKAAAELANVRARKLGSIWDEEDHRQAQNENWTEVRRPARISNDQPQWTPAALCQWRARMGWTAKHAAERLGLSQNGYAAYERGWVWKVGSNHTVRIPRPVRAQTALACERLEQLSKEPTK